MRGLVDNILEMKKEQNAKKFSMSVKSKKDEDFKNKYTELVHKLLPSKIEENFEVSSMKVKGSVG